MANHDRLNDPTYAIVEEWLDRLRTRAGCEDPIAEVDQWLDMAASSDEATERFRWGIRARWALESAAARAEREGDPNALELRTVGQLLEQAARSQFLLTG